MDTENEAPLTPWYAVEHTAEGYVLCPDCRAVMLDMTTDEDGDDLDVYWCPRCGETLFVDAMSWMPDGDGPIEASGAEG